MPDTPVPDTPPADPVQRGPTARVRASLRVSMITDGRGDAARVRDLVEAAVAHGITAVQVREPSLGARALAALCADLRPILRRVGGLLLVNDRVDVAAAGVCDGVHLGQRSLPPAAARAILGGREVIGVSAHDPAEIAAARQGGADYVSLSPVLPTACKPAAAPIGIARARAWTAAAQLPVVWLGGIDADTVRGRTMRDLRAVAGLAGLASRGALADPAGLPAAAAALREAAARLVGAS